MIFLPAFMTALLSLFLSLTLVIDNPHPAWRIFLSMVAGLVVVRIGVSMVSELIMTYKSKRRVYVPYE